MKYYYEDPMEVIWMENKFDMKFVDGRGLHITVYNEFVEAYYITSAEVSGYTESPDKAYVSPGSLHILEGKSGDLYYITEDKIAIPVDETLASLWNKRPDGYIIQRNGIPFMTPKEVI